MICEICSFEVRDRKHLSIHISHSHKNMTSKTYYDEFLKVDGEDICANCDNIVKFENLNLGYLNKKKEKKFCSISCAKLSTIVNQKQKDTCMKKYGSSTFRNPEKNKTTCLERYGVENVLCKGTYFSKKRDDIVKNKYGVYNVFQSVEVRDKIREKRNKSGDWIDYTNDKYSTYKEFYRVSWNYYKSIKSKFLETWDGYDFYDGEYIKDNFLLDSNDGDYPSIDHKISIRECFYLEKSPIETSDYDNLCVTKRRLNSSKKNIDILLFQNKIKNPSN